VPRLRSQLRLRPKNEFDLDGEDFESWTATDPFSRRNIVANAGNLFSI
jgi:hypothetical protein